MPKIISSLVAVLSHNSAAPVWVNMYGTGAASSQTTPTSSTTTTTGWWITAEMDNGIKGIDPLPAISSPFLPSVKQVPKGDGFCLQKKWINGRQGQRERGRERLAARSGPSRVVFSSGQNGGGSIIDKAPGGEELPKPQVDCREDWERGESLHPCSH